MNTIILQKKDYPNEYRNLVSYTKRLANSMKFDYRLIPDMYDLYDMIESYNVIFIGHDTYIGIESNTMYKIISGLGEGKIVTSHEPLAVVAYPKLNRDNVNPDTVKVDLHKQSILDVNNHRSSYILEL